MGKPTGKGQSPSSHVRALVKEIQAATRSAQFVVEGALPAVDPELVVQGIGDVSFPLNNRAVKSLIKYCNVAPYGKGTETRVDQRVRRTYELDPSKFTLGKKWTEAIASATRSIAGSLGLPPDQVEANLYKLLVYEPGGFFLPHRDSEKLDRMVASLTVILPNPFDGGSLIVRHGAISREILFRNAAAGTGACYAAFFADCVHEVSRVSWGTRLALTYNLVLAPGPKVRTPKPSTPTEALAGAIESWMVRYPASPLVFALDHHYTQCGLRLDLLKGTDRELAGEVAASADHAGAHVHLAKVTRHLTSVASSANDRYGFGGEQYVLSNGRTVLVSEDIEHELFGTDWVDLEGEHKQWGGVSFDPASIISSIPLELWKPTEEEYEGYTGNAGNSLDRWYHRSALVVWHRDHHYEIITRWNAADSLPDFLSLVKALPKAAKTKREALRNDCLKFARALISNWPTLRPHMQVGRQTTSTTKKFGDAVLSFHEQDLVAAFLVKLAEKDAATSLKSFVVAACRQFGWDAFERELKLLLCPGPDQFGRQGHLALRDIEWLVEVCEDPSTDPERRILAGSLCKLAVDRFCEMKHVLPWKTGGATSNESELMLRGLLRALAASGRDNDFSRALSAAQKLPEVFSLDFGHVPALTALIPWSRKRLGLVYPPLQAWFDHVRTELEQATANEPQSPTDFARPISTNCKCRYCVQLNDFLADPNAESGRIQASEDSRLHLITVIVSQKLDANHRLDRTGRPYSLVLTKTIDSYNRAAQRYKKDCCLLDDLRSLVC